MKRLLNPFLPEKQKFLKPEFINWHDHLLGKTLLKLMPYPIIPNHITLARFIFTPLVLFLIYRQQFLWGLIAFVLVMYTDAIDGAMARTRQQVTKWGKLYDPVADKFLVGGLAFLLIWQHLSQGIALAIIGMELTILIMGLVWMRQGKDLQANWWGKTKLILQAVGITLLIAAIAFNLISILPSILPVILIIFYLSLLFAFISLITYGF